MTKEQIKEKIAKRIEWLESQKDEITDEYWKEEIPFEMYDTGITELNGGICELKMILESI
jgi:hypothetical protein